MKKSIETFNKIRSLVHDLGNQLQVLQANLIEETKSDSESQRLPDSMKMIEEIINARGEQFGRVSNAEYDFIQGISESMNKWGSLTPKQNQALVNTYRSIILGEEISYK